MVKRERLTFEDGCLCFGLKESTAGFSMGNLRPRPGSGSVRFVLLLLLLRIFEVPSVALIGAFWEIVEFLRWSFAFSFSSFGFVSL